MSMLLPTLGSRMAKEQNTLEIRGVRSTTELSHCFATLNVPVQSVAGILLS